MNPQTNPIPGLESPYPLTSEQIAAYQRDGHVLLRAVVSPAEIAAWRPVIARAVQDFNTERRDLSERDTYARAFLQITNLWRRSDDVACFTLGRRFGRIAAELMQAGGARLYHDQALFKEPGGGNTPWHQDQYYWPLDGVRTITMWMPLVDVPVEMGALTFASTSQREGFLGHTKISDESEQRFSELVSERGYPVVNEAMKAGDATFHSGWTLHCAPGNQTGSMREVMTIIFFEDGARISVPDNPNRQDDLAAWFPGLRPGDAAASPINPLIYSG